MRGNAGGRAGLALVGGPAGIGAAGGGGGGGGSAAPPTPLVLSAQAGKAVMHTWLLGKVSEGQGEGHEVCGRARESTLPHTYSRPTQPTLSPPVHAQEQPTGRAFAPEPIAALAASPCGRLLAAGGTSGAAWLWEVASGRLLRAWAPHYRATGALAWEGTGLLLLTGGGDGGVAAWDVADLADAEAAEAGAVPSPLASWAEHTLPVAALWAGGGGAASLAASASADHSVCFYGAGAGTLLRSVRLPVSLTALVVEPGEHAAYAGGEDGAVYELDLVGGAAAGSSAPAPVARLAGHEAPITALATPPALAVLLSGSADGSVRVWDMRTRAPLRDLATPGRAPVAALLILPPLLAGAAGSGRLGGGGKGGGGGGGGSSAATATTTTLRPLARPGAAHARHWEGGVAALSGAAPYAGRVAATGLLGGGDPAGPGVRGWDCAGGGGGGGGASEAAPEAPAGAAEAEGDSLAALKARLAEAQAEAARWKALHGALMVEAAKMVGGGGSE